MRNRIVRAPLIERVIVFMLMSILVLPSCGCQRERRSQARFKDLWLSSHSYAIGPGTITYSWEDDFPRTGIVQLYVKKCRSEKEARTNLQELILQTRFDFAESYRHDRLKVQPYRIGTGYGEEVAFKPDNLLAVIYNCVDADESAAGNSKHAILQYEFLLDASDVLGTDKSPDHIANTSPMIGTFRTDHDRDIRQHERDLLEKLTSK